MCEVKQGCKEYIADSNQWGIGMKERKSIEFDIVDAVINRCLLLMGLFGILFGAPLVMADSAKHNQTELLLLSNNSEIGEPMLSASGGPIGNSLIERPLALAPDGKSFYLLNKDGVITNYSLKTFKKNYSFSMPGKSELEKPFYLYSKSKIFVTDDGSRMVFYNALGMMLFDLKAKEIVAKHAFGQFSHGIAFDEDKVFTVLIKKARCKNNCRVWDSVPTHFYPEISTWSQMDLSLLNKRGAINQLAAKTSSFKAGYFKFWASADYLIWIDDLSDENYWPRFSPPALAIFDKGSLEPVFLAGYKKKSVERDLLETRMRFSEDFSSLYLRDAFEYEYKFHLDKNIPTFRKGKQNVEIRFEPFEVKVANQDWASISEMSINLPLRVANRPNYLNVNKKSHLATFGNLLFDLKKNSSYRVFQYPNGEIAVQNTKTKKFKMSTRKNQYLNMKGANGVFKPMNEATFNQFYDPNLMIND